MNTKDASLNEMEVVLTFFTQLYNEPAMECTKYLWN